MKGKIEIPFLVVMDDKPLRSPIHFKINKDLKIVEKIRELRKECPKINLIIHFWDIKKRVTPLFFIWSVNCTIIIFRFEK